MGSLGYAPSEYWRMTPSEVWLLIDAKVPEKTYGNLKQSELEEMIAWREEMESKGVQLA